MDRLDCDRMFVAVLETGSFAAAALRLGTSSGQASKLVSRLEAALGVRLLNRTTRALAATEVGQAYFDRLRGILDEFDTLDAAIKSRSASPRGRLKLSAPLTFGTLKLVPALNGFALAYPDIALDVSFTDRMVNLVDEGYDVAVRAGRPADSGLMARKLCGLALVTVAAPAYIARHGAPLHPRDLAAHDCIIDTNLRDPQQWRFTLPDGVLRVPLRGRLRYSNAEACLLAAEAGLGIANLPDFVAAASLAAGRTRHVLSGHAEDFGGIHVVFPPGRPLAAKLRVLIDHLADWFHNAADDENRHA